MGRGVSRKVVAAAIGLATSHFVVWWYVWYKSIPYDQGDLEGLLWWLVAFWVLPIFACLIIVANFSCRWLTNHSEDDVGY